MTRMLLAGVLSTLFVIIIGPWFVSWLQRNEFGQNLREDGPHVNHHGKAGTPTMGGLLIFLAMTPPYFLVGKDHTAIGFVAWMTMMGCAVIGFADDWLKISNRRSLGLSGRVKLLGLGFVALCLGFAAHTFLRISTELVVPLTEYSFDLGWFYYPFLVVMLVGAANAVNLTDGLDGLAGGTVVISLMAFLGINFIYWDRWHELQSIQKSVVSLGPAGALDLAIFCSALAGACTGFLWFNAFPARVFMGDTGSIGLGGALAAVAVMTKTELLLVVIGGIFVVEALSVIAQVVSFKWFGGRRVFLMAPIHHHFELKAWSETQIMVRFWMVAGLFAATGFTIWFRTV